MNQHLLEFFFILSKRSERIAEQGSSCWQGCRAAGEEYSQENDSALHEGVSTGSQEQPCRYLNDERPKAGREDTEQAQHKELSRFTLRTTCWAVG